MLKDEAMISDARGRVGDLSNFHVRSIFNDLMLRNICEILKKCFILITLYSKEKKIQSLRLSTSFSFCYRFK